MSANQNLFDNVPAMMHSIDTTGVIVAVSQKWLDTLGYTRAEVIGRKSSDFLTEDSRRHAIETVLPAFFASGSCVDIPYRLVAKDGRLLDVLLSANCQRDAQGNIIGSIAVMQDITTQQLAERRLKLSEAALKEAQSVAHIGSWILDRQNNELIWSDELFRILEIDPEIGASKDAFLARLHPDDRDEVKRAYRSSLTYRHAYEIRHRLLFPDGRIKYIHQRSEFPAEGTELPARSLGTLQDVTPAVLQEMAYQESEERFRTIADHTYNWEYWEGPGREILYVSPSCLRVTGYSQAEFIADPSLIQRIVFAEDQAGFIQHLEEAHTQVECEVNFRIVRKDGEIRWIAHGCRAVTTSDGRSRGRRVSNRDISDLKNAEELASKLAHFDTLTGLPNRRMLQDRLWRAIAQAKRTQRPLAVMFLDVDRFKQINDTLGHDVGDQLLIEVGKRLSASVRECDMVARAGGDEFIIVLPEISAPGDAAIVAGKFITAIQRPMQVGRHSFAATASIGIAVRAGSDTDDAAEMMKKADIAMYQAKRAGRNAFRLFAETLA